MFSPKSVNGAAAALLGLGLASGAMITQAGNGSAEARAVCEAVAMDNAPKVGRLLAEYREPFTYSFTTLSLSRKGIREEKALYECNGMSLDDFAQSIGANKTAALLENGKLGGTGYVAETPRAMTDSNG